MGLCGLLLTAGIAIVPTEFLVDTDTPDSLCPDLSTTRDAVRRRLGQLDVEGGGTWRGRYSNVHDPAGQRGDYVRLVILDPKGKEQALRDLPLQGESCATMAQAIALVVDGFFRDLGQTAIREPSPARDPARPTAVQSTASNAAPAIAPATVAATPMATMTTGPIVGGGYESVVSSPAASFGWFVAGTAPWLVDLRVTIPTSTLRETHHGIDARLYAAPLRLDLNYAPKWSARLRPFVGPELLLSPERGAVEGVAQGRSGWRLTLGMGVRLGGALSVTPAWAIAMSISADFALLQSRRFLMEDEAVLELRRARLAGVLELWGAIFP